jgi:hypothetical protein
LAEKWPDEATRSLLTQRAVEDEGSDTRGAALQALAKQWPDEATRSLLTQRAVEDEDSDTRGAALQALAKKWTDETTRSLLTQRALVAPVEQERGEACSLLAAMHSELGRILMTRDLDGMFPYLDPIKRIPRKHLEKAAEKAGIPYNHMDDQVASLSAYLGWDVLAGVNKKNDAEDSGT